MNAVIWKRDGNATVLQVENSNTVKSRIEIDSVAYTLVEFAPPEWSSASRNLLVYVPVALSEKIKNARGNDVR